jgi:hypothetical protein
MSRNLTLSLTASVVADALRRISNVLCQEAEKSLLLTTAIYNDLLRPSQPVIAFVAPTSTLTALPAPGRRDQKTVQTADIMKDFQLAKFVEQQCQKLGFKTQGVKLLPDKTGVTFDFMFERQKEKEKVHVRRQR